MKKIYLSLTLLVAGSAAMAQSISKQEVSSSIGKEVTPTEHSVALDATDTLGLLDFGSQIFQYGSPTGFVFGTNVLVDDQTIPGQTISQFNYQYAAGFLANTEYNVIGAMMWFGGKADVSGTPADLEVKMYSLADDQALSSAQVQTPDVIGPDELLGSVNLPFADVDTASFNTPTFALFQDPLWSPGDFALSLDITGLYVSPAADTVWLYASEDGASDGTYTWTNIGFDIAPNTFWALSTGLLQGGLDVNLGIFALVDESGVGIEEQGFLNGVKMTTYPNPAVSSDVVRIQYGLENTAEKVEVNIFDMTGKQVFSIVEGDRAAGVHTIDVPAGTLSAGSYVYSLEANGGRMAKQLQILK